MGKHGDSMTAAAISKRMKAKGLGRLRWYCQMCEKQCRDENGFKCHTQSAGHQRQLSLFSENPNEYISRFSDTFRNEFLLVLRRRFGTSMVAANTVYQEYIKDRDHLHMNATKWTTLSEFVKELGREGYCKVQDREDGWWLSFIDRAVAERERRAREIDRRRLAEEQKAESLLRRKIQTAMESKTRLVTTRRPEEIGSNSLPQRTGPIELQIKHSAEPQLKNWELEDNPLDLSSSNFGELHEQEKHDHMSKRRKRSRWQDAPKLSAIEEIMLAEKEAKVSKVKDQRRPTKQLKFDSDSKHKAEERSWIVEDIAVKITNREVGDGAFFGQKGKVTKVINEYGARVQIFDSGVVLELDQDDLETVIPKPGGEVVLLYSPHRGQKGIISSLNIESFSVNVRLVESGQELVNLDYEAVSRRA